MSRASFIIPVYNSSSYLSGCIDSIMKQDCQDFDIYCIDDCSQDDCRMIIEEYVSKYPDRIHGLFNEKNLGQGRSRMRGVEASDSDYILFVDSDDYLAENYLSTFLKEVEHGPLDIVVAGFTKDIDGEYVEHDIVQNDWTLVTYPVACCKMYRRAFIQENHIDFSNVRKGEDIYFSIAAFCCSPRVKFIQYFGYYYRLNSSSTTESMNADSKHEEAVSRMFHQLMDKFDVAKLDQERYQMVEYAYIANMVNALITYDHGCRPRAMREKYLFFQNDLALLFPDWRKNPYYRYWGFEGPNNKIKLGVCVTMNLMKCHMAWGIYWLLSWI